MLKNQLTDKQIDEVLCAPCYLTFLHEELTRDLEACHAVLDKFTVGLLLRLYLAKYHELDVDPERVFCMKMDPDQHCPSCRAKGTVVELSDMHSFCTNCRAALEFEQTNLNRDNYRYEKQTTTIIKFKRNVSI